MEIQFDKFSENLNLVQNWNNESNDGCYLDIPPARICPKDDDKICSAVKKFVLQSGQKRIDWKQIRNTTLLTQFTPEQIKLRFKAIKYRSNFIANPLSGCVTSGLVSTAMFANESYKLLGKSEKIRRMASALENIEQKPYFDGRFFEQLPATIKSTENFKALERFFNANITEIKLLLTEATIHRLCLNSDLKTRLVLLSKYKKQRRDAKNNVNAVLNSTTITNLKFAEGMKWNPICKIIEEERTVSKTFDQGFWERVKNQTKYKGLECQLENEFFTKILPNRKIIRFIEFPKLNLNLDEPEAFLSIFYELVKLKSVPKAIQTLIEDGILSHLIKCEDWIQGFTKTLVLQEGKYFKATYSEMNLVKKVMDKWIVGCL